MASFFHLSPSLFLSLSLQHFYMLGPQKSPDSACICINIYGICCNLCCCWAFYRKFICAKLNCFFCGNITSLQRNYFEFRYIFSLIWSCVRVRGQILRWSHLPQYKNIMDKDNNYMSNVIESIQYLIGFLSCSGNWW